MFNSPGQDNQARGSLVFRLLWVVIWSDATWRKLVERMTSSSLLWGEILAKTKGKAKRINIKGCLHQLNFCVSDKIEIRAICFKVIHSWLIELFIYILYFFILYIYVYLFIYLFKILYGSGKTLILGYFQMCKNLTRMIMCSIRMTKL